MKKILLFTTLILLNLISNGQSEYSKALNLKSEKKWDESFQIFRQLLSTDSTNVDYLTNTSYVYCEVGNIKPTENERQAYFLKAEYLSKKAITIQKNNAQAHYTYALALGRINENASSRQQIANAKLIKTECEEALKLDPKIAGANHILGRWHLTIAGFNFIEKAAINTLFGGVPDGGSYEAAIDNFSKAIILEPNEIIHKFELAETYRERNNKGDNILANVWYKKVAEMKPTDEDDRNTVQKAKSRIK